MSDWLSLLYVGPHQVLPVAVALILWIALAGLGYLVTPRGRIVEANAFVGWAVVSTVFTLVGVLVERPFWVLTILAGVASIAGIVLALVRREPLFVPGSWRILVLALPLLLITGAMTPSQWDEFSHWLPAPKYLTLFDGFPTAERPDAGPQMLPAYPYAWPFLVYLAARIAGRFPDNVGGLLNLTMLLTFATYALRTAFAVAGRPRGPVIGWPLAAGVVLTVTLFNPTFVQKVILTSYSDVSCSVVTGVVLLLGYELLKTLRARDGSAVPVAWTLALVFAVLVNIRQPNSVVVAITLAAMGLAALRDREMPLTRLIGIVLAALVPTLVVYAAWRWYVGTELARVAGAEATIMPVALWNLAAIHKIVWAMAVVAFKKSMFFVPMFVACGFAARAVIRGVRSDFDRIAILTATIFVGYNAFLLFIYVAHFALPNALSVVSYWRYNMDIGGAAIIFITAGVLTAWSRHRSFDVYPRWVPATAIALVVLLPPALSEKIRFDLEPPKPHFFTVAHDLKAMGIDGARLRMLDPYGTGEAGVITRYVLGSRGQGWISGFQNTTDDAIPSFLKDVKPGDYLVVHSLAPGVTNAVGRALDPRRSYLFRREGESWVPVRDWPKPANHPW